MAVARVSLVRIDNSADSGSQSVTVPSGANAMIVGVGGYVSGSTVASRLDGASLSLDGQSLSFLVGGAILNAVGSPTGELVGLFGRAGLPAAGSYTFAWDWEGSGAWSEGGTMFLAFLSGVDQSTPFGSALAATPNGGTGSRTATTGTLTIAAGDYVGVVGYGWSPTLGGFTWGTNLTEQADAAYNSGVSAWGDGTPASNQTAAATYTWGGGGSGITGAAAVVAKASTGETVASPVLDALGDIPDTTLSAGSDLTSPVADATGDVPAPAASAGSDVTSPTLDASGTLPVPAVEGSAAEWEDLVGETGDTLLLDGDHVGYEIRCLVTAENAAGESDPEPSNELGPVTASDDAEVTAPTLDATGAVPAPTVTAGSDVTSPTLDATGDLPVPTVASDDWEDISGETGDTYELEAGDVGYEVRCVVVATNAAGDSDPEPSNELGPVEEASADAEVAAPPLTAAGDIPTPSTPISMEVTSGQLSATGDLPVPTVSGQTDATVTSPTADGTGDLPTPAVSGGVEITSPAADALGDLPVPSVTGSAQGEVVAPPLDATGAIPAPSVSGGHTITSPTLDATGDVPLPDSIGAPNPIGPSVGIGVETFLAAWRSTGDTGFPSYGQAEPALAGSAQAETGIAASAYAETLLVLA